MPLDPPDIDDQQYDEIVDEVVERIPAHTPEWTDHNERDPGQGSSISPGTIISLSLVAALITGLGYLLFGPARTVRQVVAPLSEDLLNLTSITRELIGQPGLAPGNDEKPSVEPPPPTVEVKNEPADDMQERAIEESPTVTSTQSVPIVTLAPGNTTTEIEEVWYCEALGGGQYEWYEVAITYDEAGTPIAEETVSGPYTGPWQPNCPGSEIEGSDDASNSGAERNECACEEVCVEPSVTAANQCREYDYRDCEGAPCEP